MSVCHASSVLDRITRTIRRHGMLVPGQRIGVAVSGGADSVCLLELLRELASGWNLSLTVLHVDHNLRGQESAADAEFVRGLAERFDLPFVMMRADMSERPGNLEQEARRARLSFFKQLLADGRLDRVATGHTRSDQAETVLFRFLRGSGSAGLSGIRPIAGGIIRPLLEIDGEEVREYLHSSGVVWREDSSNTSLRFARNRIRHQLLPQLAREWNPAISTVLSHAAEWAQGEEAWWKAEIDRLAAAHFVVSESAIVVSAQVLADLPVAVSRRLIRRALQTVKGGLEGVHFGHVESVLSLVNNCAGGSLYLSDLMAQRSFDWVRFALFKKPQPWQVNPAIPGTTTVPGTRLSLVLEIIDNAETSKAIACVYNNVMGCLDWTQVSGSFTLRNWRPGDRYQPVGSPSEQKLRHLFQEFRVPLWERAQWPVLESAGRIVWSRRFGTAAWCTATANSSALLTVRELADEEIGIALQGMASKPSRGGTEVA